VDPDPIDDTVDAFDPAGQEAAAPQVWAAFREACYAGVVAKAPKKAAAKRKEAPEVGVLLLEDHAPSGDVEVLLQASFDVPSCLVPQAELRMHLLAHGPAYRRCCNGRYIFALQTGPKWPVLMLCTPSTAVCFDLTCC
jgi:hypothetical protein